MISANIIQDSINSVTDDRITTFVVKFPRFVNAEILRHRALSFSSASSRAIPVKKIIQDLKDNPAFPVWWGKNQSGMQAFEELSNDERKNRYFGVVERSVESGIGESVSYACDYESSLGDLDYARRLWLAGRDSMITIAEQLQKIGLHKQISNRILEPWQNIKLIITGTDWENFFALRAHEMAQPEIRDLAYMMLEEYNKSIPVIKTPVTDNPKEFYHKWNSDFNTNFRSRLSKTAHTPFGGRMPEYLADEDRLKVSVARCARISYDNFEGGIDTQKDISLFSKLIESRPVHASAAEHVAFPIIEKTRFGNVSGWMQFRKLFQHETSGDGRVIKRRVVNGEVV